MRNPILMLVLSLIAWNGLLTYIGSTSNCCGSGILGSLLVKDGTTQVASHATSTLSFPLAGATPTIPDDVNTEFAKIATYLKDHPNKTFTIFGLYGSDETGGEQLGLGRANALKNVLVGMGAAASQILTKPKLDNSPNFHDETLYGGFDYAFDTFERAISIKDATAFTAETDDNLVFDLSSDKHNTPISDKLQTTFGKTGEYLKKNPDRSIRITGYYGEDENNGSLFPTLGLARANDIKEMFLAMGVPAKQISLADEKGAAGMVFRNQVIGGAKYAFDDSPKESNRLAELESILAQPLVLYFDTNVDDINLNAEQRTYFSHLVEYLQLNEGNSVVATGHTDNVGDPVYNRRLGRARAQSVRDYLGGKGINSERINPISKGQNEPVATNETDDGRAKNRRVEIAVKQ